MTTGTGKKKKNVEITLTPAVIEVVAPPLSVLSYIRKRMALVRMWPLDDPRRKAEKQMWRRMLSAEVQAGDGATAALTAVATGDMNPLLDFLKHAGPRGFAHLLQQYAFVDLLEDWWFDTITDTESPGRTQLQQLFAPLLYTLPGPHREQPFSQQRDTTRDATRKRQQKFRVQTQKAVDLLHTEIDTAHRAIPSRVTGDALRRERARIENRLIAAALQSDDPHRNNAGARLKKKLETDRSR